MILLLPTCCRHPFVVTLLHSWCWARWDVVFLTMNRKVGDYELYPALWKKHPDTSKAFEGRFLKKIYFSNPYNCKHLVNNKGRPHDVAPEVSALDRGLSCL